MSKHFSFYSQCLFWHMIVYTIISVMVGYWRLDIARLSYQVNYKIFFSAYHLKCTLRVQKHLMSSSKNKNKNVSGSHTACNMPLSCHFFSLSFWKAQIPSHTWLTVFDMRILANMISKTALKILLSKLAFVSHYVPKCWWRLLGGLSSSLITRGFIFFWKTVRRPWLWLCRELLKIKMMKIEL